MTDLVKSLGIIQLRGGDKLAMEQANPLLKRREVAVEADTGRIKVGDGEHYWNDLPYSGEDTSFVVEHHTLTAEEIENKAFSLSNAVAEGKENKVLLFALGVLQEVGQDYSILGSQITWVDKGMSDIDFHEGDKLQIRYEKE